ncbi:MAG TPA: hypothetical protein VK826_06205 [Bacteroidia bacterium]|nr:hypothetical protein [Bacteroidia bacterium]
MKFFIFLFAAYLTFLVTSPVICTATCEEEKEPSCCTAEATCTAEKTSKESTEDKTNGNTCCTPCCSMQNCHCFFESITEINFNVSAYSIANQYLLQDDKLNSTYLSDCWQPPEIV